MQVGPFLWEYRQKRLKFAQLLGQLGVFLTSSARPAKNGTGPIILSYMIFITARAENRRFRLLSTLRAHTKTP